MHRMRLRPVLTLWEGTCTCLPHKAMHLLRLSVHTCICYHAYLSLAAAALDPSMTYPTALNKQLLSSSTFRHTITLPSCKLVDPEVDAADAASLQVATAGVDC